MSKASELREKYEKELEELQNSCPHVLSQILPYYWAPAHQDGEAKVCMECDKILERFRPDYEALYTSSQQKL